jgi:hypothetical protein
MDPIIAKLNEIAQGKVEKSVKLPDIQNQPSAFQNTLDDSLSKVIETMKGDLSMGSSDKMNVLSADSVHVVTNNPEVSDKKAFASSDKFFDMFKQMNKDMMGLDSAVEVLSTPGMKLQPGDILKLQISMGDTTMKVEAFTRFVDLIGRSVQNLTTQVNV